MKMNTILETSPNELDRKCNEFESTHTVRFTQTALACVGEGKVYLMATQFYEDMPQPMMQQQYNQYVQDNSIPQQTEEMNVEVD